MTTLAGIIALPFLLWSWLRGGNQEDADLAAGVIGCIVMSAVAAGLTWYVLA
jgi:hypothetical protein